MTDATKHIHVTSVLQHIGIRSSFEFLKPDDREFCLGRGKMIHKVTELYDKGTLDVQSVDDRIVPFFEAYKLFRTDSCGQVKHIELSVQSGKYGYIGTMDRMYANTNLCEHNIIVDIKTNKGDTATRLQLSAYRMAYAEMHGIGKRRRGVLELKDTGKYSFELYDKESDLVDEAGWLDALRLCKWRMRYDAMKERDDK